MAKYCRERQRSPKRYDKSSFRTVKRGKRGVKQITACLKGYFKRGKCRPKKIKGKKRSALEVQSILYPEGSDPRCKRGEGGKELKRAKRHKHNPFEYKDADYIGHFPKGIAKGVRSLLASYGFRTVMAADEGNIAVYVSKGQGERALELVQEYYE